MIAIFESIFSTERYTTRAEKDQARLIYGFTLVFMLMFLLYAAFVVQRNPQSTMLEQASRNLGALLPVASTIVIGIATLVLTRIGRMDISAAGPAVTWYLSGVVTGMQRQFVLSDAGASLLLLLVLAAIFLRVRGLVVGTVVALITLAIPVIGYRFGEIGVGAYRNAVATLAFELLVAAALIYLFLRSTRLDQIEGTARASEERFKLANVTTQIAQRISRRTALSDLLNSAVEDIRDSYANIYHVQIFLIDEATRQAVLAASTGEVGRLLLERKHSLPVGSQSVIGSVTQAGEPVIARANSADSVHRRNEFLPDTVVEAAFPLRIGAGVIGALDLQSRYPGAFASDDMPIFQSLADNIAVAIDNARLFEQTEQRIQENHRLIDQMRGAMHEVERLNRDLTQQVWTEYLESKGEQLGVEVDFARKTSRTADWTPTLNEAVWSDKLIQKQTRDGVTVSIPLRVRGLVIGAMEFEIEGSEPLAPEDVDLVEAVAERFGLAVESTRLYAESRRVAQRESTLNEIGSRLQRSNSIDTVLAEAARGLQTSLGASRVAIRLGAPPKTNGGGA
ncbi:MAG: GAF domain-containing protein [Anaerolineae bacterium]